MISDDSIIGPFLLRLNQADPYYIGAVILLLSEHELAGNCVALSSRLSSRFALADRGIDHKQLMDYLVKSKLIVKSDARWHMTDEALRLSWFLRSVVTEVGGRLAGRERVRKCRAKAAKTQTTCAS